MPEAGAPGRAALLLRPEAGALAAPLAAALRAMGAESVCRLDAAPQPPSFWTRALLACDRLASRFLAGSRLPACQAAADQRLSFTGGGALPALDTLIVAGDLQLAPALLTQIPAVYRLSLGGDFGLASTLRGDATTLLTLERLTPTGAEPFAAMAVQTHRTSVTRTRAGLLATLPAFLEAAFQGKARSEFSSAAPRPMRIGVAAFLCHLVRLSGGLLERVFFRFQWRLAIMPCQAGVPDWSRLELLQQPGGVTWADPFLVERDGLAWLFFEEAPFKAAKGDGVGHIAAAPIGANGLAGPAVKVLDLPWHLSYPNVFEHEGTWYMIPESGGHGSVELYRCTSWPAEWIHHATLLKDYPGYDASILQQDGRFWMFVARRAAGVSSTDFLDLFQAPSPLGPWQLHPASPVVADVCSARPAGRPFCEGQTWVRPAQDSSGGVYGRALRLQTIAQLDDRGYREQAGAQILPNEAGGIIGIHSFARLDDFAVVDVCRKVPRSALMRLFWPAPPRPVAAPARD